ncbi:conserved hypothetical protein [Beutenbergia cavernae DSM 12333]|uniref:MobA-like NTP transferase domain-containing protein n=1 Tax=Beutenbergia cavernae (strain ATCC BAA-8 / DSM 12333 / CCUG 43141 / JCM 11478 / NBRC 16432 / NCIMB 13614 / HKI 0122) TaxID=471853 RepID=C5C432_BEUC1|nr:NTP transferase domain-containing protein [Beutenbergia cavernae]ACQ79945.1 conserved hypothetical protein [Beutenbergia cavernae DSM 12333]
MSTPEAPRLAGLVLAAGAGRRMGGPKALLTTASGETWVRRAARMLRDAGCDPVLVTVGAAADDVVAALDSDVTVVRVPDWEEGLGAGVRAGLARIDPEASDAVVVVPVDVLTTAAADVTAVVDAVVVAGASGQPPAAALRHGLGRALHDGAPGHPVVIGAERVAEAIAQARGDAGPRALLAGAVGVEIGPRPDLDTPADVAAAADAPGGHGPRGALGWRGREEDG